MYDSGYGPGYGYSNGYSNGGYQRQGASTGSALPLLGALGAGLLLGDLIGGF